MAFCGYNTKFYLVGVSLLVVTCAVVAGSEPCGRGQFLDGGSGECRECSTCKKRNHIIRVPCTAYSDTQCGPFYEFSFAQGGGDPGDSTGETAGDGGPTPGEEGGDGPGGTYGYDELSLGDITGAPSDANEQHDKGKPQAKHNCLSITY